MATKAKRRYVSKNDLEEMLQAFYDGLGDNENTSLGHRFPDEDEVDAESYSSDDDDDDDDDGDNHEDNERDNGYKMEEEEECETEDNSNDSITMMLFLKKRLLALKSKKPMRNKIARMMNLRMYQNNEQENKNSRILIKS